jgi:hypothetical protein
LLSSPITSSLLLVNWVPALRNYNNKRPRKRHLRRERARRGNERSEKPRHKMRMETLGSGKRRITAQLKLLLLLMDP